MRARNIKPGFFTNDRLAECEPLARLLFAGLWTIADRSGRLEDRPKRIKAEVLPYDDCNVDALLNSLHVAKFIKRYNNCITSYIQIVNFEKHQNPHVKEQPSTIPAPDENSTSTIQEPDETGSCPADSLLLIPDSIKPSCAILPDSTTKKTSVSYTPEFEEAWQEYPKRTGGNSKMEAFKAWKARIKEGVEASVLTDGVRRYRSFVQANGKAGTEFVKQAATFFGPASHYLEPWTAAPTAARVTVPDDEWILLSPEKRAAIRAARGW